MIRQRLRELDIKITEIADYLNLSRPTMYKFIESYDSGKTDEVHKKVVKLFDYIEQNDLIDKRNVINYVLSNLAEVKDLGTEEETSAIKTIRRYLSKNPGSEKARFIEECCAKSSYDVIIHYISEIAPILGKKRLTEEEKELLAPYKQIVALYTKQ